jgi:hypothetical protein
MRTIAVAASRPITTRDPHECHSIDTCRCSISVGRARWFSGPPARRCDSFRWMAINRRRY